MEIKLSPEDIKEMERLHQNMVDALFQVNTAMEKSLSDFGKNVVRGFSRVGIPDPIAKQEKE